MRLTAIVMAIAMAANFAYGQSAAGETKSQEPSHEGYEAEVIHVKTLTGDSFSRLANLLSVFQAQIRSDANLRTIIVYAPKDVVAQMRRVVAELDTPGSEAAIGRNIEMTLTLLRCSTKAPATTTNLPMEIEPVAKQLRASTQYKDIQLWDVIPLRLQEGKSTTQDMVMPNPESAPTVAGQPTIMNLRITPEAATRKGQDWSVRFGELMLDFKIPIVTGTFGGPDKNNVQYSFQNVGLKTAGDFMAGQKTVLGKVSGSESDTAIFAVISLKVLD